MKKIAIILLVLTLGITNSYSQTTKADLEKVFQHVDISNPSVITIEIWLKTRFSSETGRLLKAQEEYSKGSIKKIELLSSGLFITGGNSRYYVTYDNIKSIATYKDDSSIRIFLVD